MAQRQVAVPTRFTEAVRATTSLPIVSLGHYPTPVEEMPRLREKLGIGARLLVKRDDAIAFGFGGNKVRKLQVVAADARAAGADTLVTMGGVQSNHARATAATAAKLGMGCLLIVNGAKPERPTANALLDELLGAEIEYVGSREERAPAMRDATVRLRREGRVPFEVPLGASTPRGALAFVRAIGELLLQVEAPDVIVHASSSGGTQAGLVAGCALHGLATRVIGVSADDPAAAIRAQVASIMAGMAGLLGVPPSDLPDEGNIEVDDEFVGEGYGIPSPASLEAQRLAARCEALFVDNTYTAKALAAMIAYARRGELTGRNGAAAGSVMFWHTGGQVGLFASG